MKYSIRVNEVRGKEGSNVKGFATVVFGDSFKITNIAILENKDKEDIEKIETIENKPERVEAEIVYAPMVAETHEYQYNADAFEARGSADVKVEAPKEVPMVRTEKAR